jgi:hypothetical protein
VTRVGLVRAGNLGRRNVDSLGRDDRRDRPRHGWRGLRHGVGSAAVGRGLRRLDVGDRIRAEGLRLGRERRRGERRRRVRHDRLGRRLGGRDGPRGGGRRRGLGDRRRGGGGGRSLERAGACGRLGSCGRGLSPLSRRRGRRRLRKSGCRRIDGLGSGVRDRGRIGSRRSRRRRLRRGDGRRIRRRARRRSCDAGLGCRGRHGGNDRSRWRGLRRSRERRRQRRRRARRQQGQRVDVALPLRRHADPEVHGRIGRVGRWPDRSDRRTLGDDGTAGDGDRAEVNERDRVAVRRRDRHGPAAVRDGAREGDGSARGRHDVVADRPAHVDASVLAARIRLCRIEDERAEQRARRRPRPGARRRRSAERQCKGEQQRTAHRSPPVLSDPQTEMAR